MVVLGAFVNGLVAAGFTSFISVLYVEWAVHFQIGAGELSWIGFLFPGTAGFVSFVTGFAWSKIGVRATAFIGAVLASSGCLAGAFATKPSHIALAIGVVSGLGVGFCYISSINMVAIYFNRRFGIANSIMFLGTSISQIGIPPLTRFLVASYGWRGALLINSALVANSMAASCLFRPLPVRRRPKISGESNKSYEEDAEEYVDVVDVNVICRLSTPVGTPVIQRKERLDHRFDAVEEAPSGSERGSTRHLRTKPRHGVELPSDSNSLSPPIPLYVDRSQNVRPGSLEVSEEEGKGMMPTSDQCTSLSNAVSMPSAKMSDERARRTRSTERNHGVKRVGELVADMLGITLFWNEPLAILQNLSSIVVMIGTFPVVAHVMAMAIDCGMTHSKAATLLSVLGVGGTVGRIVVGAAVDKGIIGPHMFMMVVNILTTLPLFAMPFVIDVFAQAAVTIFFAGIGIGASIVLRIVQAKKVVSPAFISDAVRIVVMTTGVGMTVGAVLSGWLADVTGSYSMSFFFSADVLLFGAATNLLLSVISRCRKRKERVDELESGNQTRV
ncbi:monocarboxylate transporter 12-like [Diadema setosum]|uniref:monocarboxylate transporter 12-like n=1 Tax=Diadema setosum TaxID=31175 RepID=UPI003B3AE5F2